MIDLKEFLKEHHLILDEERQVAETARVLMSRNKLLSEARGSLRQHLQQQLMDAIRRFNEERPPEDPSMLV